MNRINILTSEQLSSDKPIWVNPIGGLGDVLMLSTALKASYDKYGKQFHLARRTRYTEFFKNHPAICKIGHPTPDADIITNDYWSREEYLDANNKALDINLKMFGISEPVDDLYWVLPGIDTQTKILLSEIPWTDKTVVISVSSDSPRKIMHPIKWHIITQELISAGCFVIQVGTSRDVPIKGAYCLIGSTTPSQIYHLLKKANLVITHDNFIMHAAKAAKVQTISIFGPTNSKRYAYPDHYAIQNDISKCPEHEICIGPHASENYSKPCPLGEHHCMNETNEGKIIDTAISLINRKA